MTKMDMKICPKKKKITIQPDCKIKPSNGVFNERPKNSYTSEQTVTEPKTTLYIGVYPVKRYHLSNTLYSGN